MAKVHVKKGDSVYVLNGKDGGKKGKVLSVIPAADPSNNKVLVEGVNIVTKHVKPRQGMQQGGLIHQESPINASKVMLICAKCNKPTKVGHKVLDNGAKARFCKKCGETIDVIGEKE
jgi:large subunit ribosomal protein L24